MVSISTGLLPSRSIGLTTRRGFARAFAVLGALLSVQLAIAADDTKPTNGATSADSAVPRSVLQLLYPHPTLADGQSATLMPDGKWLLLGGIGQVDKAGSVSAKALMLDPRNDRTVTLTTVLQKPRRDHSATLLSDGSVLVLGGLDAQGHIAPAERFDPATGKFTLLPELNLIGRSLHAATLLADGHLLISGGLNNRGEPLVDAELLNTFNEQVERFSPRIDVARFGHIASLLPSNAVVLVGGYNAQGKPVPDAEVYDVEHGVFAPIERTDLIAQAKALSGAQVPAIVGSLPTAESRDVNIEQVIALRFAKRMLVSSINSNTLTLVGPAGAVPVKVVPAETGLLGFITPRQSLLPGSTYTLFVKSATDEFGRTLPFTTIAFTTRTLAANGESTSNAAGVSASTAASVGTNTEKLRTALPPANLAKTTPDNFASNDDDDSVWLPGEYQRRGHWHYAQPFAGTMREYFKYIDERRLAHRAESLQAAPGMTAVSGTVRRLDGSPLAGVSLTVGQRTVRSDAQGRFLIAGLTAGKSTLEIEGSTANYGHNYYGSYLRQVELAAGETTTLDQPIYLAKLDPAGTVSLPSPTTQETVVRSASIPGLEIRIPAGSVIRDRNGNVITEINITPIPLDRAAYPMPQQVDFPVYFTLQPAGAYIQSANGSNPKPATLTYPNYGNLPANLPVQFWAYDPQDKGWHIYAEGNVSADGERISMKTGLGFYQFTGFSFGFFGQAGGAPGGCKDQCCPGGAPGTGSTGGGDSDGGAGAGSANSSTCGDPVLITRGTFLHTQTDLSVADTLPISLDRTFMDQDSLDRAFGKGMLHSYDINLYPLEAQPGMTDIAHSAAKIALVQPNGVQLVFKRVFGSGSGNYDATWEHTDSTGRFYKAVIVSKQPNFELRLRDGTIYVFYGYGINKLQAIRDRFGNQIELARNPALSGPVTKIISPNGRYIELSYDTYSHITSARDNIGNTVSYEYETTGGVNYGRLKKVTLPDGGIWQYTYTSTGRVDSVFDPRNNRMVQNQYDPNGRVSLQTYADNTTTSMAYTQDGTGKVTQVDVTDKRGNVRRVLFDANLAITQSTYPLGKPEEQITKFQWNANGLLANVIDALNRVTAYNYDALGNRTSVTHLYGTPQAVTESYTYDSTYSLLKTRTDALTHTTTYNYDGLGNLVEIKDANNNSVTVSYDSAGRPQNITNALSNASTLTYNGPDLVSIANPLGFNTVLGYDAIGRVQTTRDPLGNVSEFDYDPMGRTILQRNPLGSTIIYGYDLAGNLTSHRDQSSNLTSFAYDALNRQNSRTDGLLASESALYEAGSELLRFTDRKGQISGYKVDGLGRTTFVGFGANSSTPTVYTSGIRYTWDSGNRLTRIEDGSCSGLDCASFTVISTIARTYNDLNQLTREVTSQGQIDYTYYANGLRQSMTVLGQPTITYSYDPADRLTQISQAAGALNGNLVQTVSFTYDIANRRMRTTLANGATIDYGYDAASRLTSLTYRKADTSLIGDLVYTLDAGGRIVGTSGSLAAAALPTADMTATTYNAANQLTAATQGSAQTLTYDANGNLTGDGTYTYVWNARDQLVEVKQGSTSLASFVYDAEGRRIRKTVSGSTTQYLYDGWNSALELDGALSPARLLLNGPGLDERYGRFSASQQQHFLTDQLGSTRKLLDQAQSTLVDYQYDAYGNGTNSNAAVDNPYQYTGRENDAVAGLMQYRNRYYSAALGRFISQDPIEISGGVNLYAYVEGNPVNSNDGLGLEPGKGERGYSGGAGGTSNPEKHWKEDPKNPGWGWQKDPQTGKKTYKRRPPYIKPPEEPETKSQMCGPKCQGAILLTGVCILCIAQPELCPLAVGGGVAATQ